MKNLRANPAIRFVESQLTVKQYDMVIRFWQSSKNRAVRKAVEVVSEIDSISDFDAYREAVGEMKYQLSRYHGNLNLHFFGQESSFYGHLKTIAEYAGLKLSQKLFTFVPEMEHGIDFRGGMPHSSHVGAIHSRVFQGPYRKKLLLKHFPYLPNYVIGPYIWYAKSYYEDQHINEIRKKNGKTLVYFPSHTSEQEEGLQQSSKSILSGISSLRDDFDTIVACVYWNDVDAPFVERLRAEGVQLVSAGTRLNDDFLQRLRTILLISDCVAGCALGTHIGYALTLGKPFYLLDATDTERKQLNFDGLLTMSVDSSMRDAFSVTSYAENEQKRQTLFGNYWGGEDYVRSPEEIRAMFIIGEEVMAESCGKPNEYHNAYRRLRKRYLQGSSSEDVLKHQLLEEAMKE